VNPELLRKIEPFPTKELAAYDAGFLAGWVVEQYQIDLIAAAQHSRERMNRQLEQMCASQVPGDTYRNLEVHPHYARQTFKHVLLPVWLLTFDYGQKIFQVLVNGYTGAIAGKYPLSAVKIFLLILVLVLVALGFFALAHR
jgi:hypothetical protein